jgi:hypothetical protein
MKKHFGFFGFKSVEMRSSLSGLLHASAHVRQGRSRYLRCCPEMAVTTLGLPTDRARGGHDPLIRRSRHIVQARPLRPVRWADIPQVPI